MRLGRGAGHAVEEAALHLFEQARRLVEAPRAAGRASDCRCRAPGRRFRPGRAAGRRNRRRRPRRRDTRSSAIRRPTCRAWPRRSRPGSGASRRRRPGGNRCACSTRPAVAAFGRGHAAEQGTVLHLGGHLRQMLARPECRGTLVAIGLNSLVEFSGFGSNVSMWLGAAGHEQQDAILVARLAVRIGPAARAASVFSQPVAGHAESRSRTEAKPDRGGTTWMYRTWTFVCERFGCVPAAALDSVIEHELGTIEQGPHRVAVGLRLVAARRRHSRRCASSRRPSAVGRACAGTCLRSLARAWRPS